MKYIFAFDLSISCVGIAIFDTIGNLVEVLSIKTNPKQTHGERLRQIGDKFCDLRYQYNTSTIVIERAFSLHNISTQVLYRVHGLTNYLFYDCTQVYYAPTTIKKAITGTGKADKEEVKRIILKEHFPDATFKNTDESDAVAIGLTYFIDKKII